MYFKLHLFVIFTYCFIFFSPPVRSQVIYGKATYISDGDTFRFISIDSIKYKVRIAGIDCPERLQPFGLEAKEFVMHRILETGISINIKNTDRYGRKVASVCFDGKDLGAELLKMGLAWQYNTYSKDLKMKKFEQKARKKKLGLWSVANPIPPWEFRTNQKKLKSK